MSTSHATGSDDAVLAAFERAVELVPAEPPSPERAYALGSLAGALMVAWRYAESLPIGEQALALAREVGAREAEVRALTVLGGDLAYLGHGEEGLDHFRQALQLAEEIGDLIGLERAYVNLTDVLTMLGRPRESARLGQAGLEEMRRYGIESVLLVVNQIEALVAIGEWDEAERLSAAALRGITSSFRHGLMLRAEVEIGRGEFEAARAHLAAARATLWEDLVLGLYDVRLAELALWERRWTDADAGRRRPAWLGHAATRRPSSASSSAPRDCAHMRSSPRSPAPAATPTPSDRLDRARKLHHRCSPCRRRGLGDHPQRRRLARRGRGGVPACPRRPAAGAVVRRCRDVGPARTPAACGLLPLAPGRGARRRRRLPHRGERAAAGGARRRRSDRGEAAVARTRTARPTRPARSRGASRAAAERQQGLEEILGLTPARPRSSTSSPAATPTARSPRHSSSAPRRRAGRLVVSAHVASGPCRSS